MGSVVSWIREIAKIHREGVKLELRQLGLGLDLKHSLDWFMMMWNHQDCDIGTHRIDRKIVGFVTNIDGEVMIYVDPEHHSNGIGSTLLSMVQGDVWVVEGNKIAEDFYTKNGFSKTKESRKAEMFEHKVVENLWKRGDDDNK